jgi:3-hydroxybutyryl-CoA dehydratase
MKTHGIGLYWDDQQVGDRYRTFARTITETDLVMFVNVTGMTEVLFVDETFEPPGQAKPPGRVVPGALVYTLMEGFICQGPIQGTGLAMLELEQKILAPTFVGETVHCEVEVTTIKPTSKGNRAVVTTMNTVKSTAGEVKLVYKAVRMTAGRPK